MSVFDARASLVKSERVSSTHVGELGFESKDLLHPFEVDALVGQLLNPSQGREVIVGEAPRTPTRSLRVQESTSLVVPQGLGMDPGQLGEH
jgi:hypothetical protein